MRTLPAPLLAAQRSSSSVPYLKVTVSDRIGGHPGGGVLAPVHRERGGRLPRGRHAGRRLACSSAFERRPPLLPPRCEHRAWQRSCIFVRTRARRGTARVPF